MVKSFAIKRAFLSLWMLYSSHALAGSFLPQNNLHLEDSLLQSNISEQEFYEIIETITRPFHRLAAIHGAELNVVPDWSNSDVNAEASQTDDTWMVTFFGGLARRPEMTKDGFSLVICHELGHHFGGYPFIFNWGHWPLSVEGNADYYAAHYCVRQAWQGDDNSSFEAVAPPHVKTLCDESWDLVEDQQLCYRIAMAGISVSSLWGELDGEMPSIDQTDTHETQGTVNHHPGAQCRLDTYFQGALCATPFQPEIIPGKNHPDGQRSSAAREEAYAVSCSGRDGELGARPRCWFDPRDIWKQ